MQDTLWNYISQIRVSLIKQSFWETKVFGVLFSLMSVVR